MTGGMKTLQAIFTGIGSALVLGVLVFGSLAVSLIGNGVPVGQAMNLQADGMRAIQTLSDDAGSDGSSLNPPESKSIFPPPPSDCLPPTGWHPITISPGETLKSIAMLYATTGERVMEANCMESDSLVAGMTLYVPELPPTPTVTATPTPTFTEAPEDKRETKSPGDTETCGRPAGWVVYIIRAGDTLYNLALLTKTTVASLQRANCLGSSTLIHPGELFYVPFQPVVTTFPTRPAYKSPTPTAIPTQVVTTPPPTATELPTATPVPTEKPKPPTKTPQPTDPPPPTEPPTEPPPEP
jgi:LysM repeat protein